MSKRLLTVLAGTLILAAAVTAQYTPWLYWTFLPRAQMDEIVGEASGESAWNTIAEINAFNRERFGEEFARNFLETQVVVRKLKSYGLAGIDVVTYPGGQAWVAVKGELWETKPGRQKLASIRDMLPMLASGSATADVTAELVWVGRGTPKEITDAKVEGKIVVAEGNMMAAYGSASQQGALGVIAISASRPYFDPLQMPWSGIMSRRRPAGAAPGQPGQPPAPAQVGKALAGRRHEVVLATKAHNRTGPGPNDLGNSRLHLLRACEDSLRRLGTDYIDLYQMHRASPEIPIDEFGALTDLVRAGKVRYIGCSTHPAWMVMEALAASERLSLARYVSEQPPYNLLDRRIEKELVPLARRYDLAILPWAPLPQGVLAGRYDLGADLPADSRAARLPGCIYSQRVTPRGVEAGHRLAALAREHGKTPGQLALAWCKDQPGITAPIAGPRTEAQLAELSRDPGARPSPWQTGSCPTSRGAPGADPRAGEEHGQESGGAYYGSHEKGSRSDCRMISRRLFSEVLPNFRRNLAIRHLVHCLNIHNPSLKPVMLKTFL